MRDHLMKLINLSMFLLLCLKKVVSVNPFPAATPNLPQFPMAKLGCSSTCVGGDTEIPYPFGIGPDCALSEAYNITCYDSEPHLRIGGFDHKVGVVSLGNKTVTIWNPIQFYQFIPDRRTTPSYNESSIDLNDTPFFFSKDQNKLTLFGCGNALLYQNRSVGSQVLSGCTSTCKVDTSSNISGCFGINCCEANIPFHLKQYWISFTRPEENCNNATWSCGNAVLTDIHSKQYNFSQNLVNICEPSSPLVVVYQAVLSWTIQNPNVTDAILGCNRKTTSLELESGNVTDYGCECKAFGSQTWSYKINPYLNGSCDYAASILINGSRKNTKAAIIGASVGSGLLFLVIAICTLYKLINEWCTKMRKRKFFERNGGLLLQQQLSAHAGAVEKTKVLTIEELKKASDGFNANRILGEGGQGTVYKGMLTDGSIVAIKKSNKIDANDQLKQFINELFILSQINHRNVVKLLGCCLETEVPLLVYEFIPNGTLYNLLHNENSEEFPLTWNMRLRIAREIANAVAYFHSATSTPIFHKDIKSNNILLGEKYIAKVSDFGISRSVAIDQTHLTSTRVIGTPGYVDPEYIQSHKFTEKSDVYSYGVVLVELLTRQKPVSARIGESYLAARFLTTVRQGALKTILDPVIDDGRFEEEVIAVAKLAGRCLNLRGERRPTMREVVWELERLDLSTLDSTTQANSPRPSPIWEEYSESGMLSGTVHTWTFGINAGVSSVLDDASHLLSNTA